MFKGFHVQRLVFGGLGVVRFGVCGFFERSRFGSGDRGFLR